MRPALRKTLAVVTLASCAFACAGTRASAGDQEATQTRAASPVASGEEGRPAVAAPPSPMPTSSVATPEVTLDAAAPLSRIATADELSDASASGRSLQEQMRAAAAASDASATSFSRDGTVPFIGPSLQSCKRPGGPTGSGHVVVTFAKTGEVRSVVVDGGPFAGTPVGDCIAERFKKVRVAPFAGEAVRIGKSFSIN